MGHALLHLHLALFPYQARRGRWLLLQQVLPCRSLVFGLPLPKRTRVVCCVMRGGAQPSALGSLRLQQNMSGTVTEGQARSPWRVVVSDRRGGSHFPPAMCQLTPSPRGRGGVGRWLRVAAVVLVFGELAWGGEQREERSPCFWQQHVSKRLQLLVKLRWLISDLEVLLSL